MNYIYRLFRKQKITFLLAFICSVGSIAVTIVWNSELAEMINMLQSGSSGWTERILYCVVLVVMGALCQGGMVLFSSYAGETAVHELRMRMADAVLHKKYAGSIKQNSGEQLTLQLNEMEEVKQYVSENLFVLFSDVINFICTLLFLLSQNTKLTLLCNIPVLLLLIYTTVSSKVIYGYTIREQEELKRMNGISSTVLSLFPILRLYEAERLMQEKYSINILSWKKAVVSQEKLKARLMSVSGMISCLPLLLLLLIGGTMVIGGSFSIGMLYVFINLSGNVSGVMANMPGHLANYRRFKGNLDRVLKFMEENGGQE